MQLSVIIINYNVKYFLEYCLLSVRKAVKNIDAEIIVIDNASNDGSFEFFQNKFEEIQFIWNKKNSGFAKANNQGLEIAKGEYILFLNPDTIIPEDCLKKSISFIQSYHNNCALGIKMLDGSGRFLKESKRAFPSPITSFYKLSGLTKTFPHSKIFAKYYLGNLSKNKNQQVDVLAGAYMMIPKKILEKTSGFDEQFFMYGEDIDLSYRIQEAGFKNYFFAKCPIIHFKGESTQKESLNYVKTFYNAMGIFVKKHYGRSQSGIFSLCLHSAIIFRGTVAGISRVSKRVIKTKEVETDKNSQVVVAGNENEFEAVKNLLKSAGKNTQLIGRIETDNILNSNTIGSFRNLKNVFSFCDAEEIIFCEGSLSFKEIISAMPNVPKDVAIKLFSKGSHSIIGSTDKDETGEVILKAE